MVSFYQMLPDRFRNLIDDHPQTIEDIWRWDCCLYDAIMVHILPNIYTPITSGALKQLRNYTRQLLQYIRYSVDDSYPDELYQKKAGVAQLFYSKVKRHLKLNQMAQTTLAVLQHPSNFESMRCDWDAVDFESIMEQATWVCNCNHEEVQHLCKYLMWG
ncbi:hypothetical protein K492DRAFT_133820 [Lichtheimia hyalospora FSU 10163]|nr:hypothetical protein K492DRAFT_133820 [Lichtheimia hyalospora FSU 10163]